MERAVYDLSTEALVKSDNEKPPYTPEFADTESKELMRQIAVLRKTKPAYEGLKAAKKPEQYREQTRAKRQELDR